MTSVHSCVCWCFSLKGQYHKIFASGFFHESSSSKPLKILQNLLHFRTFRMCGNLWICNLRTQFFCNLRNCDLLTQICCRLTTSANLQIHYFSACKYMLKCSNSNFYQIKNSAKRTYSWLLDSFAIKGGIFLKDV